MSSPRVPLRKCATPRCGRHVHGNARKGHCRACCFELDYNAKVMLGRYVGQVAGRLIVGALRCSG